MSNIKAAFKVAREILAADAERGLTATFSEKRSLYRMARNGCIMWRCTFESGPYYISVSGDHP